MNKHEKRSENIQDAFFGSESKNVKELLLAFYTNYLAIYRTKNISMKFKLTFLILFFCIYSSAQSLPELRYADKIRIREAINISTQFGNKLFKGYSTVPFAIVLVTDSTEFLINHPNPSSDFKLLGKDDVLKTNIYYRKTQFNPHFLATFPAVNGVSCIVAGTPENTNKNSTEWVITLLHEHFHQYQNTYPDYFTSVDSLNLSGGDQTGMWMLNYPFPYDSLPIKNQYALFTKALYNTVTNINSKNYQSNLAQYLYERGKLKDLLSPADYRYFSFQIWQEGLATHTEYSFLELLAKYIPSKEILVLPDYVPFADVKSKMYHNQTEGLLKNKLNEMQRVCFYSIGFAEGVVLNKENKFWRKKYLTDKFYIEHYLKKYR
jgi:hypothetical protein